MRQEFEGANTFTGRRSFLKQAAAGLNLAGLVASAAPFGAPADSASKPAPRARRVLFNWDGDDVMDFAPAPMSRAQFVEFVFEPLEHSSVDAVLWCPAGGNEAAYRSKVLEPGAPLPATSSTVTLPGGGRPTRRL